MFLKYCHKGLRKTKTGNRFGFSGSLQCFIKQLVEGILNDNYIELEYCNDLMNFSIKFKSNSSVPIIQGTFNSVSLILS